MSQLNIKPEQLVKILKQAVKSRNLEKFYPPAQQDALFSQIAIDSVPLLLQLSEDWNITGRKSKSLILNLVQLALYDIVFYLDDSGSMRIGDRISDLYQILSYATKACSILDQDGITLCFINHPTVYENIKSDQQIHDIVHGIEYKYKTVLAGNMKSKIIKPLILDNLESGASKKSSFKGLFSKKSAKPAPVAANAPLAIPKPILIITMTDGQPTEPIDDMGNLISYTKTKLEKAGYSSNSIAFQFTQVGDDEQAKDFLEYLDNHPKYGSLVDAMGTFAEESKEILQKKGIELSFQMWIIKLLLGAIDSEFDKMDEVDTSV